MQGGGGSGVWHWGDPEVSTLWFNPKVSTVFVFFCGTLQTPTVDNSDGLPDPSFGQPVEPRHGLQCVPRRAALAGNGPDVHARVASIPDLGARIEMFLRHEAVGTAELPREKAGFWVSQE